MLEFKKYSSIENSFSREFMEHVVAEMPQDLECVVQEKVHGANTSFLCDGETVRFAKRTSMLEDGEQFYDYPELLERYKARVLKLYTDIKAKYSEVAHISVFGEMFGGLYPHDDVKAERKVSLIQKGVCYTPGHEFYGFDIYLFSDDKGRYLPVDEVNDLFEANGFFYAKTLFRGTLAECLKYPNAFQSKIAEWLGLPAIDDNICEGIVIRPVVPMYLKNGSRVLIKSKNERFAEKKSVKKRNKLFAEPVPYSETLQALIVEGEAYITENRLTNVLSHIGEVHFPKDFGRVMGLFSKDVLEDFLKEHGGSYSSLDKCEQKSLNEELNKLCTSLVKQVYMSQAYIIE
ncbi:MAG: RNA ligase, Rnl2 family [Bacteroidaceae bacterium]|nr:RNA ligase, Rnl2 family [Bacteroidaceae bacterium]